MKKEVLWGATNNNNLDTQDEEEYESGEEKLTIRTKELFKYAQSRNVLLQQYQHRQRDREPAVFFPFFHLHPHSFTFAMTRLCLWRNHRRIFIFCALEFVKYNELWVVFPWFCCCREKKVSIFWGSSLSKSSRTFLWTFQHSNISSIQYDRKITKLSANFQPFSSHILPHHLHLCEAPTNEYEYPHSCGWENVERDDDECKHMWRKKELWKNEKSSARRRVFVVVEYTRIIRLKV